jgi:hypothetical protein
MAKIEVQIFRNGKKIKRIMCPVGSIEGKPAVRYRRRWWPLINGKEVHIEKRNYSTDSSVTENRGQTFHQSVTETQSLPPPLIVWDKHQRKVIGAAPEARLLVSAGPGTGKTAVACARVAELINQGLEPSHLWLISFTRTAVHEIRDRIAAYIRDEGAAYAVVIATLDSRAWAIHSGFNEDARILGSYEENIEQVLELIRKGGSVADYLEMVEHLVVDEAQDIVGVRADLVIAIIDRLSKDCGVTVFADEAQAIYGFADNEEVGDCTERRPPLPEKIRRWHSAGFEERELPDVHRTDSPQLLSIFTDIRRKVLAPPEQKKNKLADIKSEIIRLAHGEVSNEHQKWLSEHSDAFILYRRRCDVLLASSFLGDVPHRIRMSGLPTSIAPWVGATLGEFTDPSLDEETFMDLWSSNVNGGPLASYDESEAWEHLVRIAGQTKKIVDMRRLRQRLSRKQPPAEICAAEVGHHGPIIGTIHACKGREASVVHLMLPGNSGDITDQDEEARVVFVGATRGRMKLMTGNGYYQRTQRIEPSGRVYSLKTKDKKPRAQVEFGHDGDIFAEGLTGRNYFGSAAYVRICQKTLKDLAGETGLMLAESDPSVKFAYRLKQNGHDMCLAVLSQNVNSDLFMIADKIRQRIGGGKLRPPNMIPFLRLHGLRSIVLAPDAPECELLHEPWASTGIMLAPVVIGYSTISFFRYRKKRRW